MAHIIFLYKSRVSFYPNLYQWRKGEKYRGRDWLRQSIVRHHEHLYRVTPLIFAASIRRSSYSIPRDELVRVLRLINLHQHEYLPSFFGIPVHIHHRQGLPYLRRLATLIDHYCLLLTNPPLPPPWRWSKVKRSPNDYTFSSVPLNRKVT